MNRQAEISTSAGSTSSLPGSIGLTNGRLSSNLPGELFFDRHVENRFRMPEPQTFPKRVYRVTLTRGVQEITCTHVATDEGFLKFYNHVLTQPGMSTCSVVAMIPSTTVQLVTSVLESEQVVV